MAILLVPLCLVALRCAGSSQIAFLRSDRDAPWIMAPEPVSARLRQWGETRAPVTRFSRRFDAARSGGPVRLQLRSLGAVRVELNGSELAAPSGARGRQELVVDPGAALREGENEIAVEVSNPRGPGLLSLRSEGWSPVLRSDPTWSVSVDGHVYASAIPADDTRGDPRSLAVETPAEAVMEKRDALLLLAVLGGLAFLGGRRALSERGAGMLPGLALAAASGGWLLLFFTRAARIPAAVGFDARHHLHYANWLLERGSLPLATDGWSTYHPPLFYGISAGVMRLGGGGAALKAVPLLAGLGLVWTTWGLARRLAPRAPGLQALAVLFAAVLPVSLYSASYFSNESLHALLASAALLAMVDLLLAPGLRWRLVVAAAALFGLAALTKFTVLVALPVAFFFLAWKLVGVERIALPRVLRALGLFAGVFLAVAGWFYARNWLELGAPVVGNWALPGEGRDWWLPPGFHTAAWYTGFGESLVHPYMAGFHSLWDGLYSTFWGDGYIAGRGDPSGRHGFWDYGFMSAGYWLALPASGFLLGGAALGLREILGGRPPRQRLALGLLATVGYAVGLAFLTLTLEIPVFAQAKAAYLLMLTGPLALAFAAGFGAADGWLERRGWLPARVLLYAWLATFAGTLFLAFVA